MLLRSALHACCTALKIFPYVLCLLSAVTSPPHSSLYRCPGDTILVIKSLLTSKLQLTDWQGVHTSHHIPTTTLAWETRAPPGTVPSSAIVLFSTISSSPSSQNQTTRQSAAPRAFRVGSKEEEPFFGSLPENQWLPHHFIKIHPPSELQIPRTRWSTKERGVNQLKSCLN